MYYSKSLYDMINIYTLLKLFFNKLLYITFIVILLFFCLLCSSFPCT